MQISHRIVSRLSYFNSKKLLLARLDEQIAVGPNEYVGCDSTMNVHEEFGCDFVYLIQLVDIVEVEYEICPHVVCLGC